MGLLHRSRICITNNAYLLCYVLAVSSQIRFADTLPISLASSSTALRLVENMASVVAAPPKKYGGDPQASRLRISDDEKDVRKLEGLGGKVYASGKKDSETSMPTSLGLATPDPPAENSKEQEQVWTTLSRLESNMELLDDLAGQKQQLNGLEFTILTACIGAAVSGPMIGGGVTEFVAPASAAICAAVGIGAEYVGKTAVADGKEVAALSIICAAEAEAVLAQAERSKAIAPLCVGIGATAATCSLVIPGIMEASGLVFSAPGVKELYLLCPVAGVLSAAIAGLSNQEVRQFSQAAIGVGNRRFARSGSVGKTWLSAAEQVARKSDTGRKKLTTFAYSVIPAPLLGVLIPGSLATKAVVVSAFGALESAFFLAEAEYILARAVDAVALKTRSAAVCDTYANQGSRSSAILPFTSALSALCAASTAAIVELPFFHASASASAATVAGQTLAVSVFPAFAALFAGAASVSKARCEVDAEAAMQAASTLSLEDEEGAKSPVIQPVQAVRELIRLTLSNSLVKPSEKARRRLSFFLRFPRRWLFRRSLRRDFKTFDSDGDGLLSGAELRRCVNKHGVSLTDQEAVEMIQEFDTDGDGKINYDEFRKMLISPSSAADS